MIFVIVLVRFILGSVWFRCVLVSSLVIVFIGGNVVGYVIGVGML